jgi:hypothetical protein
MNARRQRIQLLADLLSPAKLPLVNLLPHEERSVQDLITKIMLSPTTRTTRSREQIEYDVRTSKRGDATLASYLELLNATVTVNDEELTKDRSWDIHIQGPTYWDPSLASLKLELKSHPPQALNFSLRRKLTTETVCLLWQRFDAFVAWKTEGTTFIPWFTALPELFASVNRHHWHIHPNGSGTINPHNHPEFITIIT